MESQPIKKVGKIKKIAISFLFASFLSAIFLVICMPFLTTGDDLSYAKKANLGGANLWRVVIIYGLLTIATTILFIKQKKHKITVIILWVFWLLGTSTVVYFAKNNLSSDIFKISLLEVGNGFLRIWLILVWFFGIYYCRKVAMKFNMSGSNAILASIFLPVLSILIYFFYSYRKNTKEGRTKIIKITAGSVIALVLISAGAVYYIVGTPEYSLYKLRELIINNNSVETEKYLDIKSIANNFGESPSQSQEWIDSLGNSVLEIKEENSDKSKDAVAYIPTGLTGKNLKNVSLEYYTNQGITKPQISLKFDNKGSNLFAEITNRNIGKRIAIFLDGNLISAPVVQTEISNGLAVVSEIDNNQAKFITDAINEEKAGMIAGFKIRNKILNGNSAKITIGKANNASGFELSMEMMKGRYWRVDKIDVAFVASGEKLPAPQGEKVATFNWKYKGKNYSLDEKLYDSYYKFYNSLPAVDVFNGESIVGKWEKDNELFINEFEGDKTIEELAQSIKLLGEKNNLNENQLVELVSAFVQTIPYDTEKFNNRKAGLNGSAEKPTYPYEVLYDNKGVCQDKSYLAYILLKKIGYGVSLFLFPDPADNHMAMGIKCPIEYSNYNSGYCFLETTSLGNKIGSTPNLSKEFGTATSKVELSDFSNDSTESDYSPLGKIEILNKIDGLTYTGVIDTFNTQKEIDNLFYAIRKMDGELNASKKDLDNQNEKIGKIVDKLDRLAKSSKNGSMSAYNDYNDLYPDYKKASSSYEKDRKAFNAKVATRNQMNDRYNSLVKSFYQ